MARTRYPNDDLFSRAELLRQRQPETHRNMRLEADAATGDSLLQALVGAAAIISYADGQMDIAERRRLIEAFSTSKPLDGFSVADFAEELAFYMRAYAYDLISAEAQALANLATIVLSSPEKAPVAEMCGRVLAADGMVHPAELGALGRIQIALEIEEFRS
jgi:tellurite resistance protein